MCPQHRFHPDIKRKMAGSFHSRPAKTDGGDRGQSVEIGVPASLSTGTGKGVGCHNTTPALAADRLNDVIQKGERETSN
ncbi:MAG: hypothetical protein PHT51_04615 [Patescibacteria group bacterium]|nr:hypothetical protein [Patescibacteria group bacterium]MDD4610977.1 hypothetical protein [Patescibacteria group bacterium]